MNVEIGTETPIFLFWEYLFRYFGILSLQCVESTTPHMGDMESFRVAYTGSLQLPVSLILVLEVGDSPYRCQWELIFDYEYFREFADKIAKALTVE
jgi:hypothetical protein